MTTTLDEIIQPYAERFSERGEGLGGAVSLTCFDLREVNRVDARSFGQSFLGQAAPTAIDPDRILSRHESVNDLDREGFASSPLGEIVKRLVTQQRVGVSMGQSLVFTPGHHCERWLSGLVEYDLRRSHVSLLSSVNLPARGDPEYVNDSVLVVSLEDDSHVPDSQAITSPTSEWSDINISSAGVFGQSVECASNATSLLARHSSQVPDDLSSDNQFVCRILHNLNIA